LLLSGSQIPKDLNIGATLLWLGDDKVATNELEELLIDVVYKRKVDEIKKYQSESETPE
jgi:hypothetical protein